VLLNSTHSSKRSESNRVAVCCRGGLLRRFIPDARMSCDRRKAASKSSKNLLPEGLVRAVQKIERANRLSPVSPVRGSRRIRQKTVVCHHSTSPPFQSTSLSSLSSHVCTLCGYLSVSALGLGLTSTTLLSGVQWLVASDVVDDVYLRNPFATISDMSTSDS
jgi:hypothetical protein